MKTKALLLIFFLIAFCAGAQNKYRNSASSSGVTTKKKIRATVSKNEDELAKKIMLDLVTMNIISDTNDVTFTLSDKKMEVNHKILPDEIFAHFKEKYFPQLNSGFPELLPADSITVTQ